MKSRPILFSAAMIRAILSGAKTQTRRLLQEPAETLSILDAHGPGWDVGRGGAYRMVAGGTFVVPFRRPYAFCGDRLWPKEGHAIRRDVDPKTHLDKARHYLRYRADYGDGDLGMEWHDYGHGWRPSIFMPRWASRITLEITEVRVQRLQEISEADVVAEGLGPDDIRCDGECGATPCALAVPAFKRLWNSINGKRAPWHGNPWVWALTFRRVP